MAVVVVLKAPTLGPTVLHDRPFAHTQRVFSHTVSVSVTVSWIGLNQNDLLDIVEKFAGSKESGCAVWEEA